MGPSSKEELESLRTQLASEIKALTSEISEMEARANDQESNANDNIQQELVNKNNLLRRRQIQMSYLDRSGKSAIRAKTDAWKELNMHERMVQEIKMQRQAKNAQQIGKTVAEQSMGEQPIETSDSFSSQDIPNVARPVKINRVVNQTQQPVNEQPVETLSSKEIDELINQIQQSNPDNKTQQTIRMTEPETMNFNSADHQSPVSHPDIPWAVDPTKQTTQTFEPETIVPDSAFFQNPTEQLQQIQQEEMKRKAPETPKATESYENLKRPVKITRSDKKIEPSQEVETPNLPAKISFFSRMMGSVKGFFGRIKERLLKKDDRDEIIDGDLGEVTSEIADTKGKQVTQEPKKEQETQEPKIEQEIQEPKKERVTQEPKVGENISKSSEEIRKLIDERKQRIEEDEYTYTDEYTDEELTALTNELRIAEEREKVDQGEKEKTPKAEEKKTRTVEELEELYNQRINRLEEDGYTYTDMYIDEELTELSEELRKVKELEKTDQGKTNQGKTEEKKQWNEKLTQDQKDELIAEGLEPGDPEYLQALENYGIKPTLRDTVIVNDKNLDQKEPTREEVLQEQLRDSAKKMQEYKTGGFIEQEAAERASYSKIVSEIGRLHDNKSNPDNEPPKDDKFESER